MSAPIRHGGGVADAAARYGGCETAWLDLSTGINPCPPVLPEIEERTWHRLPDRSLDVAACEAARVFYHSGTILPLAVPGTQSVIQVLPRLADPTRHIAIFSPTYGEYARAFALAGFEVDGVASMDDIGPQHQLVVLVNPNNPDGRVFSSAEVEALAQRLAAQGSYLVVDEAFCDCSPEVSVAARVERSPNLIVFRSFGKFFGMAGMRLGFVIAEASLREQFSTWLGPWAVSGPALSVASSLMQGEADVIRKSLLERRAALDAVLNAAGLRVRGGTALFSLVELDDAAGLHDHLCQCHILTRVFDYAPKWMRLGLAPDADGDHRLASALADWKAMRS